MTIPTRYTEVKKTKPADESKLGFGKLFTDHMLLMDYNAGQGWHDMRVEPYGPFAMDPSSVVLHYGQAIFEGLKCFRGADGALRLFRAQDNFLRMNASAERMSIPAIDPEQCLAGLKYLLDIERDWIPSAPGTSLYIRPTIIATDAALGIHASKAYRFFIILSPSGAYYASGLAPVGIYVESELVRAVRGGIGFTKAAANYAASLYAGVRAEEKGYQQVLWLDGVERKYIEEVGAMNIMFAFGDRIITPMLSGSILKGITRGSILTLAADLGYTVEERRITIDEVVEGIRSGALTEAFGTGTAAVVSPIGTLCWNDTVLTVGDGGIGKVTQRLYNTLTGIQSGALPDPYGWTTTL
ncbi:branched chain amino acid aminotransferase [Clostridia bacterium]|nr:branched chain amino acid aminotransferase [Clostridia bacterium]